MGRLLSCQVPGREQEGMLVAGTDMRHAHAYEAARCVWFSVLARAWLGLEPG